MCGLDVVILVSQGRELWLRKTTQFFQVYKNMVGKTGLHWDLSDTKAFILFVVVIFIDKL